MNMRRLIDAIAARNSRYPIGAMLRFNEELRTIGRVADPVAQRPLSLPTAEPKADVATGPIRWNGDSLVAVGTRVASRPPLRSVRAAFPHTAQSLHCVVEFARHFGLK